MRRTPFRAHRHRKVALAAGALALGFMACSEDDIATSEPEPVQPAPQPEAGPPAASCPVARAGAPASEPRWSRNPETGDCCLYDDRLEAPDSWPAFDTEEQCRGSCRCTTIEVSGADPLTSYSRELTSLECLCASEACPSNARQAIDDACGSALAGAGFPFVRAEGCGRVMIRAAGGLGGTSWVFDAAADSLIGAGLRGDTTQLPCQTYDTIAGQDFDCEDVTECLLCGDPDFGVRLPPSCQ